MRLEDGISFNIPHFCGKTFTEMEIPAKIAVFWKNIHIKKLKFCLYSVIKDAAVLIERHPEKNSKITDFHEMPIWHID